MYVSIVLALLAIWLFVRTWWGHLPHLIVDKAGLA